MKNAALLSLLALVTSVSNLAQAGVSVPAANQLPCFSVALVSAQRAILKTGEYVGDTEISTAKLSDGVSRFEISIKAGAEGESYEDNMRSVLVDVYRNSRKQKCEVLDVKVLGQDSGL